LEIGEAGSMFERALNLFWIALGAGAAAYATTLGVVGASGPESGLFPLIASLIVMVSGLVLLVSSASGASSAVYPRGPALLRVLGVVGGVAFLALAIPYLGFAISGAITMMILLRTVERAHWGESVILSLGSIALVVWLFGHVLGMALPRGPWGW
jgi:putative tricarboxylic transport membrane protein